MSFSFSYPVSFPSRAPARVSWGGISKVGKARSIFTGARQVFAHQGQWLEGTLEWPPMTRAQAEQVVAFLLSLNGVEGTFTMTPPECSAPQGSWAGSSPKVAGGSQSGNQLILNNLAEGLAAAAGDWLQVMDGAISRLHKVVRAATVSGSPLDLRLDIWPRLRSSPVDGSDVTLASPKGTFCLKDDGKMRWDIGEAVIYGVSVDFEEAL